MEEQVRTKEQVQSQVDNLLNIDFVENLIKDNKIEFEVESQKYRMRLLTYKERQSLYKKRADKYLELLNTKNSEGEYLYKLEIDLKNLYKERGIDIDEMNNKFQILESQKKVLQEKLGQSLTKEASSNVELESYKKEIESLINMQKEISIKKSTLFEFSIENQILIFMYIFTAFLATEKLVNEKWVKVWNAFEDFENDTNNQLINTSVYYATILSNYELMKQ